MPETPPWIAVVDDDPAVLRALSRLLRSRAFDVSTFASGEAFLASLPHGLPKCLIVDLQMPTMSGLALQRRLADDGLHIPMIMITAQDDAALREHEMAGFVAFLRKPLQDSSLFTAVDKVMGRPVSSS
jgi:FixJ family two-component response regulator